jgi:hypothetical protein
MNNDDLKAKLIAIQAELDRMTRDFETERYESASKQLALSLRHQVANKVVACPCIKGSPSEHVRITNDLLNHCIKFQVNPKSPAREITLDWSRKFLLSVYSNGQLMACFQTAFDGDRLVLKNRTEQEFINCCMEDLGYEKFKEAA